MTLFSWCCRYKLSSEPHTYFLWMRHRTRCVVIITAAQKVISWQSENKVWTQKNDKALVKKMVVLMGGKSFLTWLLHHIENPYRQWLNPCSTAVAQRGYIYSRDTLCSARPPLMYYWDLFKSSWIELQIKSLFFKIIFWLNYEHIPQ